jgi:hypothetical protein
MGAYRCTQRQIVTLVDGEAALRHDLLQIQVAERVSQIPPDAQHDDHVFEMSPTERDFPLFVAIDSPGEGGRKRRRRPLLLLASSSVWFLELLRARATSCCQPMNRPRSNGNPACRMRARRNVSNVRPGVGCASVRPPRVVVRPEILDGATHAGKTRAGRTCAGCLDPDGTRDRATPATNGTNLRASATATTRPVKPVRAADKQPRRERLHETGAAVSRPSRSAPRSTNGAARARRTRDPGATCVRLLDPDGTRAHAAERRMARIVRASATAAAMVLQS